MTEGRAAADTALARIAGAVRGYTPSVVERDTPCFEAAVALVLRTTPNDGVELLLIERASRAGDPWSGQIALPGGRHAAADRTLECTAVRETREETGLDLHRQGEVIGALSEIRPRTPLLPPVIVRPFVATVAACATVATSDEVASHFWVSLDALFAPQASRTAELLVNGIRIHSDAIHHEGHVIWGMTERILRDFEAVTR